MIDAEKLTDEALIAFDQMMVDCSLQVAKTSAVADAVWSDVMREMGKRGLVQLLAGSYDNVRGANIVRLKH